MKSRDSQQMTLSVIERVSTFDFPAFWLDKKHVTTRNIWWTINGKIVTQRTSLILWAAAPKILKVYVIMKSTFNLRKIGRNFRLSYQTVKIILHSFQAVVHIHVKSDTAENSKIPIVVKSGMGARILAYLYLLVLYSSIICVHSDPSYFRCKIFAVAISL